MLPIMKIEISKLIRSKQHHIYSSAFLLFIILTIGIMYYNSRIENNEITLLSLIYNMFAFNSDIFFPFIAVIFFSSLITKEFHDKTIKLLVGTKYNRVNLILGKFFSGALLFISIFLIVVILSLIITLFLPINKNDFIGYDKISLHTILSRTITIAIFTAIYLISYGGLAFMIALWSKNQVVTLLISIGVLLFYIIIPFPSWLRDYIFIGKGQMLYTALALNNFPFLNILKSTLISIFYLFLFLTLSVCIFQKTELK